MEYEHHYDLFGVTIRLTTDSLRMHEEARLFLDAYRTDPTANPRYALVFRETPKMPELAGGRLRACRGHEHQIIEEPQGSYISVAEGRAWLDTARRECQGYIFPKVNGHWRPRGSVLLIHPLIIRIMFAEGFLPLHAAAISVRNRLVMLTGAKGAGKSTLALKFHQRGYSLLGDDLLYLQRSSGGLVGGGHCQPVKLKPGEFPWIADQCKKIEGPIRMGQKTLFALPDLRRDRINQLLPAMALVFLTKPADAGAPAIVWADRETEVLFHLLGDSLLANTPGYHDRALDLLCADGSCRLYLAQTHADADQTLDALLNPLEPHGAVDA